LPGLVKAEAERYQLAGNDAFAAEQYQQAIDYFTQSIEKAEDTRSGQ